MPFSPFLVWSTCLGTFDVVGLGQNSVDYVAVAATHPAPNSKQRLEQFACLPGGQVATAIVACARLGWRTRYIGSFGDDAAGRLSRESLAAEGVDIGAARTVPGATNRLAVILVDARTGERTVLWHHDPALRMDRWTTPRARLPRPAACCSSIVKMSRRPRRRRRPPVGRHSDNRRHRGCAIRHARAAPGNRRDYFRGGISVRADRARGPRTSSRSDRARIPRPARVRDAWRRGQPGAMRRARDSNRALRRRMRRQHWGRRRVSGCLCVGMPPVARRATSRRFWLMPMRPRRSVAGPSARAAACRRPGKSTACCRRGPCRPGCFNLFPGAAQV